jgi:diaphanous 1
MYQLAPERKKYLLRQNRQFRSTSTNIQVPSKAPLNQGYAASYGPASAATILPKLVPTLTGDQASPGSGGIMKRFSITGIWGGAAPSSSQAPVPAPIPEIPPPPLPETPTSPIPPVPEALPIVPQITGSLWGNWWSSKDQDKAKESAKPKSAGWYVDGIRNGKPTDSRLAKHLISLKVHLSTANVAWIGMFLEVEKGMDALGTLLAGLVGKGGKRSVYTLPREDLLMACAGENLRIRRKRSYSKRSSVFGCYSTPNQVSQSCSPPLH